MSYQETPTRTPSSSALIQSSSSSSAPQRSLNRQIILEEDEYTAGLDYIIRRDFFPSLAPLQATNSYLSALETHDPVLIQASVRRLAELERATPTPRTRGRGMGSTPYVNWPTDTPLRTPSISSSSQEKPAFDTSLSLDAFQAKYTSEDNASFTEVLDDENMKRRDKHAWAWNAQDRAMQKRKREIEGRQRLLIEAQAKSNNDDSLVNEEVRRKKVERGDVPLLLENGQTNERAKMLKLNATPAEAEAEEEDEVMRELVESDDEVDGQALVVSKVEKTMESGQLILQKKASEDAPPVDVMAPTKDQRSTAIPAWPFKTRNSLMFLPDANESPYHRPPQATTSSDTSDQKNRGPPKTIIHANTRLPSQSEPTPNSSQPPSPTRSRIAAAITGTPYHPSSSSPKIRGYGFVEELPTPKPDEMEPEQIKQLMTWGTIMSTPRILSSEDGDSGIIPADSPFVIKAPNSRDALGRKLGGEAGRSLAKKAGLMSGSISTTRTPAPTSSGRNVTGTPRRSDMLTPAARRLLDRTRGGGSTPGGLLGKPANNLRSSLGGTPGGVSSNKRRKELDLRKVGWSPRDTPRISG